jgi:very-short-patch-repair endonuclease
MGEGLGERVNDMPNGLGFAKVLRRSMTDTERLIWSHVRAGRFGEWKFRRQVPLGPYIVDFVCFRARLIVELDGGQHVDRAEYDADRTAGLEARGFRVIRFWNHDVLLRTDDVLAAIWAALDPSPPPLGPARATRAGVRRAAACGGISRLTRKGRGA